MKKIQKVFILLIQIFLYIYPLIYAQSQSRFQTLPDSPIKTLDDVLRYIDKIINWAFTFLLALSVLFFILAAFDYLFSAGEKEKIERAKNRLIYGALAIAVALLSRGIPIIVRDFLQSPGSSPNNIPPPQRLPSVSA